MANEANQPRRLNGLYRLAVLIMSTISAVTTALGAEDLFGFPMAVALAIGLSVLLVAIALNLPRAFQEGRQWTLIAGYTFIALISVLFNFNYIYGKFAAEDLLYTELINKREKVDDIEVAALNTMDKKLEVEDLRKSISEYEQVMKREKNHPLPGESGEGPRYQEAALNKQLAEERLSVSLDSKRDYYQRVSADTELMKNTIDQATDSNGDLAQYRNAIESTVTSYNELRNYLLKEVPEMQIESMRFVNKDIGKLNHTLWTFTQFGKLTGKQKSSLIIATIIALAIDFVVLFVLALVAGGQKNESRHKLDNYSYEMANPPKKKPKNSPKSDKDLFYRE